jgi:MerR family transcriptional regulator, mercuric resistance operon regulatory protein
VRRVRFIRRAQDIGFSLAEVATLLELAAGGPDCCDRVRALAEEKIADLRRCIGELQALHAGLTRLVATCERPRALRECPIMQDLDSGTPADTAGPDASRGEPRDVSWAR